jgi:hypothetical protein
MSGKMTVVYLDHTGHVLAALREPPSGPPKLEALIGEAFPLRAVRSSAGTATPGLFELPASVLKSKSVALDERVIAGPQRFVVDGDRVALLPDPPPAATTVDTFEQTSITLALAPAPLAPTKVLTMLRGAAADYREQRIQGGSFAAAVANVALNFTVVPAGPDAALESGRECNICIAVAGHPLIYAEDTTP